MYDSCLIQQIIIIKTIVIQRIVVEELLKCHNTSFEMRPFKVWEVL